MDGLLCPECGCPDVVVYSSFGSAVIPCRGIINYYIHQVVTPLVADGHKGRPCKGLIHFRNLSSL